MLEPAIAPLIDDAKARLAAAFGVGFGPLDDAVLALQGEVSDTLMAQVALLAQAEAGGRVDVAQAQIAHARLVRLLRRNARPPLSAAHRNARIVMVGKALAAVVLVQLAVKLVW